MSEPSESKGEILFHSLSPHEKQLVAKAALRAFLKERQARSTPKKTEGNRLPSKREAIKRGIAAYWEKEMARRAEAKASGLADCERLLRGADRLAESEAIFKNMVKAKGYPLVD
jgi:hypothetical protein